MRFIELVICFIWGIVLPLLIVAFSKYIFRKNAWIIILIEIPMMLFFTLTDILTRYPIGNIKYKLTSYFMNITNNFYLRYLPFVILTTICIVYFKGKINIKDLNIMKESDFSNYYFLGRWTKKYIDDTECMYTINLGLEIDTKIKGTKSIRIKF